PHYRVEHILYLASEHDLAPPGIGLASEQRPEGQHLAKYRGGLGEGQRRICHQVSLLFGEQLMNAMAELMRQRHHITDLALVIEQQIGVRARHRRMRKRTRRLAGPDRCIDPSPGEKRPPTAAISAEKAP